MNPQTPLPIPPNVSWIDKLASFYKENSIHHNVYDSIHLLPRYVRVVGQSCYFLNQDPPSKKPNPLPHTPSPPQSPSQIESLSALLESEIGSTVTPSHLIHGLLRISDPNAKINNCNLYKTGKIVGLDLSSALAAITLEVTPNDHVLDLCCAPGGKLLLIADILGSFGLPSNNSYGTITGVDISEQRLSTCRSILKKSSTPSAKIRARLYVGDGSKFDIQPPPDSWWDYSYHKDIQFAYKNNKTNIDKSNIPWFSSKLLRSPALYQESIASQSNTNVLSNNTKIISNTTQHPETPCDNINQHRKLYDKVLVDAECTHDGSLVHLYKYVNNSAIGKLDTDFLSPERVEAVSNLQYSLLINGWNQLKVGGTLVYSTCSLSYKQNEMIVAKFLQFANNFTNSDHYTAIVEQPNFVNSQPLTIDKASIDNHSQNSNNSEIIHIQNSSNHQPKETKKRKHVGLKTQELILDQIYIDFKEHLNKISSIVNCVRLDPRVSDTSGMFISKIKKLR
ncbi:hypothetical protein BB559_007179 [Furculomyces boomerangus]|uniref:SAM-dependent MTase RsmB/NOP-type domain-containing protein n=2 Tax=Harpellales TaxID=61421 RepID=A0A2T9XYH7_9FUNG|nr:hypothetical protein BB559_007179 [Furculomyces boomerangus]PVZ99921.1 hypothetical protein BB558_004039 [Smittium angustum]